MSLTTRDLTSDISSIIWIILENELFGWIQSKLRKYSVFELGQFWRSCQIQIEQALKILLLKIEEITCFEFELFVFEFESDLTTIPLLFASIFHVSQFRDV